MKKIIRKVLDEFGDTQINLSSEAAREIVSTLISSTLKTKGSYNEYTALEIEEQKAQESWVCSICGKNTYYIDFDYIGSEYNHLSCELEVEMREKKDEEKVGVRPFNLAVFGDSEDLTDTKIARGEDRRKGDRREKNWSQKKHEDKVFNQTQLTNDREYPFNSFVRDKQEQIKARGVIRPKKRVKKKFDEV